MARTLYIPDGSTEFVFGDPEDTLQKVIYERLGRDCEELYKEILADLREDFTGCDDYEKIADGYRSMLNDTLERLVEILYEFDKPGLNRQEVQKSLRDLRDNLYNNM